MESNEVAKLLSLFLGSIATSLSYNNSIFVLTDSYRIDPDLEQELQMLNWPETCRKVYNDALGERQDWLNSRKCSVNTCSLQKEYIISD
ncbi:MAG: helix-turn-helix domain-containing protein [Sodalinema sp.]|uniref:helix-turn-helix domain-containing protein n=1 Tax=Sodalinema sp. TaxID=3080550 RepID=UPI0012178A79|nr:MAG: hypothetical protein EYR95_08535 [Phormidium sp. SL48-SHIP]